MKKLKNYSINADSEVYSISLVDEPAVESNFIYLSQQKPIYLESDEKHMIYGCALRPDFPIYRRYEEEEFYVTFSKDTVEKLSQKFLKNGFQANWTQMHESDVKDLYAVESWIKTDMKHDKSVALGLDKDLPIGTWFVGCKVENEDIWQKVKDGEFQGFSIEAFVELDEINLSKNTQKDMLNVEMDEQGLLDKIKAIILDALGKSEDKPEEEPEIVDNAAEEVVEVAEEELKDEPTEEIVEASEDVPVDEVVEEAVEEVVATVEENAETEAEVENELQAVVDELNAKIAELENTVEELQKENKKLGKKPSAEPVKMHSEKQDPWEIINQLRNGR